MKCSQIFVILVLTSILGSCSETKNIAINTKKTVGNTVGITWRANFEKDRLEYDDELIFLNQDFTKIVDLGTHRSMDIVVYGSTQFLAQTLNLERNLAVGLMPVKSQRSNCNQLSDFTSYKRLFHESSFDTTVFSVEWNQDVSDYSEGLSSFEFSLLLDKQIVALGCEYILTFYNSRFGPVQSMNPTESTRYKFKVDRDNFTLGLFTGLLAIVMFLTLSTI